MLVILIHLSIDHPILDQVYLAKRAISIDLFGDGEYFRLSVQLAGADEHIDEWLQLQVWCSFIRSYFIFSVRFGAALAAFNGRVALVILKKLRFDPSHLEKAIVVQTVLVLVDHFVQFAEFKAVELDLI